MTPSPLFLAAVIGPTKPKFAHQMCLGIVNGIQANGCDARFFAINDRKKYFLLQEYYWQRRRDGLPFHIIDINGAVLQPPPDIHLRAKFSYIIDHPVFHLERIRDYPGKLVAGYVDIIQKADQDILGLTQPSVFLPHAGPEPESDILPMAERDLDILYCGNISPLLISEVAWERLQRMPEAIQPLVRESIDRIIAGGLPPFRCILDVAREHSIDLIGDFDAAELEDACSMVEDFVTAVYRVEVLKSLSGLNLHVVGQIPRDLGKTAVFGEAANLSIYNYIPFDRMIGMLKRTKLLLNMNPVLAGGSHERIWEGMANGCAIATNESIFMRECFEDGREILIAGHDKEAFAQGIAEVIGNENALTAMASAAMEKFAKDHTWAVRVRDIIMAMESLP